jgi:hypothetical protein
MDEPMMPQKYAKKFKMKSTMTPELREVWTKSFYVFLLDVLSMQCGINERFCTEVLNASVKREQENWWELITYYQSNPHAKTLVDSIRKFEHAQSWSWWHTRIDESWRSVSSTFILV